MCHSQLVLRVMMLELDEWAMRFVPQPNTHIPPHHFLPVAIGKLEKLEFRSNTATRQDRILKFGIGFSIKLVLIYHIAFSISL